MFGIDSISDIIATEAGARLAQDLLMEDSTIENTTILKQRLDYHMKEARTALLHDPVFIDKEKTLDAFLSVHTFVGDNGQYAPPTYNWVNPDTGNTSIITIWKATLGTIATKVVDRFKTDDQRSDFMLKVSNDLRDMTATTILDSAGNVVLDATDVKALRQVLEILSFINEDR